MLLFFFLGFLCSGDDPSPPLTLLNTTPCTAIALTQAVVQRELQSEVGGRKRGGDVESRPQHRQVKRAVGGSGSGYLAMWIL